jgi:predicted transcriptional regulator
MKKRDRLEIIKDILEILRDKGEKVRPTHIMYKANLSHQMLTEYTTELIEKKLIEQTKDKKGKKIFLITKKGLGYLKDFNVIRGFVDSYGLD